ncbi:LADA_0F03950g1_1 [Lachancea dasiensis]|uniref:LADA_0F03950g1_1 n=1 Tax=Lachancea dasiensis TaxID=1072105 RepID=A0A1G4JJQ5_9SACH|nr:LADA_0F03950g1_1 [Lachancea dasiensis]
MNLRCTRDGRRTEIRIQRMHTDTHRVKHLLLKSGIFQAFPPTATSHRLAMGHTGLIHSSHAVGSPLAQMTLLSTSAAKHPSRSVSRADLYLRLISEMRPLANHVMRSISVFNDQANLSLFVAVKNFFQLGRRDEHHSQISSSKPVFVNLHQL